MTALADDTSLQAAAKPPLLAFDNVDLALQGDSAGSFSVELALMAGDLMIVEPGDEAHLRALVDAVCGLKKPLRGSVRFLDRDWSELPPEYANALRGRIGHLFSSGCWLPYLSIRDNLLLAQRYHTKESLLALSDEAVRLAKQFGLPGLPAGMPSETAAQDLQRAGYVGAFLGQPELLLLDTTVNPPEPSLLDPLVNAVRAARDRGAAVLWFTLDRLFWRRHSLPITAFYEMRGIRLQLAEVAP